MLRIAIQSKGRLFEDSMAMFSDLGIETGNTKGRLVSRATNFPIELLFMRDDDIPLTVSNGTADLGIVGYNEVVEKGFPVKIVKKLGFGGCRISLAVPKGENYEGKEYFNGRKIATSYPSILKKYLDDNGIKATVEVISGSVEIAPAAGIADAIFDIVSSGSTLVSNGLKEVEKVFESEAVLISGSNLPEEYRQTVDEMLFRLESANISKGKKYILMNLPEASLEKAIKILPAMRSPTVLPLAAEGWCSLHSVVDTALLWEKVRQLKEIGAEGILVLNVDKIII